MMAAGCPAANEHLWHLAGRGSEPLRWWKPKGTSMGATSGIVERSDSAFRTLLRVTKVCCFVLLFFTMIDNHSRFGEIKRYAKTLFTHSLDSQTQKLSNRRKW